MSVLKSPHERSRKVVTSLSLEAGRRQAEDVSKWMNGHEDAFWKLYDYVKGLQASGTKGRVRDRVAIFAVKSNISVGEQFKFANGYWAGIARYMALYDPSLIEAPLKFNDSDIDCFGLFPIEWLDIEEKS